MSRLSNVSAPAISHAPRWRIAACVGIFGLWAACAAIAQSDPAPMQPVTEPAQPTGGAEPATPGANVTPSDQPPKADASPNSPNDPNPKSPGAGSPTAANPAAPNTATLPGQPIPAGAKPLVARAIEVKGDVKTRPSPEAAWAPVKEGDELAGGAQLLTGLRSAIKLQFGEQEPYMCVLIDSVSLTEISESLLTDDAKRVRVGVGYGRIRAGVAEGGLKSDFTVDTPVATLSKRGTWNFGIDYERGTGRFEAFLLDRGLVDVMNSMTAQRRQLQPGQFVTQAMRRWGEEVQLRQNVAIADILGQGDINVAFNTLRQSGLGVLNPGQGRAALLNLSNSFASSNFATLAQQQLATRPPITTIMQPPGNTGPIGGRREGLFGFGRGGDLITIVIDPTNPLVQRGYAQPGRYSFRRAALENWLQNARR
ncbi:MAG: hypothetical protein KDA32_15360 [Phycisphaerales bacterium]|nr:hypothetical protein [Phycisphaerales bacterium]